MPVKISVLTNQSTVHGEDIMVKFNALQSAKVPDSKTPKRQRDVLNGVLAERILAELCSNSEITQ
jgi:hypothetical protein